MIADRARGDATRAAKKAIGNAKTRSAIVTSAAMTTVWSEIR